MNKNVFKTSPAIFAVGENYQILIPVKKETLMGVKVGNEIFYDHVNGTMKSATNIHRVSVPQSLLDKEKSYIVFYRVVKERKPYFTQTEPEEQVSFNFKPLTNTPKAFLIADAHNEVTATVNAVKQFETKYGEIDFLILAGDVPNDSGKVENFDTIYKIIEGVTKGEKPVVYAKGNHDLRGVMAEKMEEYAPNLNGKSYFSFKLGNVWGLSLDCGEDKDDSNEEYGHTVCCHQFRLEQTEYIEEIIKNAKDEYSKNSVKYKIIVSHNPFSEQLKEPFNIEKELFSKWCKLLKDNVRPDLMISGHLHRIEDNEIGSDKDHLGQPCRVIVGAKPYKDEDGANHFIGTGLFFEDEIKFVFIDDKGIEYKA